MKTFNKLKNSLKNVRVGYIILACIITIGIFVAQSFLHSMPNSYVKSYYARADAAASNLKTVDDNYRMIAEYVASMGSGSSGRVYLSALSTYYYYIYSASALRSFSTYVNNTSAQDGTNNKTNAILMCSIDLGTSNFTPIGSYSRNYKGIFLGCGYKISNLKATESAGNDRGLFGYVSDSATIWNVIVDSGTIYCDGGNSAGAIAGYLGSSSQIIGCQNWGCSITEASGSSLNCGGIVGWVEGSSVVAGCYNKASVSCNSNNGGSGLTRRAGGIAGRVANSTIMECKNTGNVYAGNNSTTSTAYAGGIVGELYQSQVTNCLVSGSTINSYAYKTTSGATSGYMSYSGGLAGYCTHGASRDLSYSSVRSCKINGGSVSHNYSATGETGWISTGYSVKQTTPHINGGPANYSFKRQQASLKYSLTASIGIYNNVDDFCGGYSSLSYYGLKKSSNTCDRNDGSISYVVSETKYGAVSNKSGAWYHYGAPNQYAIDNQLGSSGTPSYTNKGSVSATGSYSPGDYKEISKSHSSYSVTFTPYTGGSSTYKFTSDLYVVLDEGDSGNQAVVGYVVLIYVNGSLFGSLNMGAFQYTVTEAIPASYFSNRDTTSTWFTKDSQDELRCLYWEGRAETPA